ncbi:hypothetical protein [Aphanothece hegewaldii]|uniref:hypothetical protein n=1 Tax=Aphanothece hegewaldii TaxID=1521625 RepID=UPI0015E73A76|nr:hypothetical protein [Aphanothece hegewaldii]
MSIKTLNETELNEILKIAQNGEAKLKEMSDRATMMAEKWRVKTINYKKDTV